MTIAVVWTEDGCNNLFAASDTRITSLKSGPSVRLTDSASKLLPIPYSCREISYEPGLERHPFFWGSLGFAFSGNSSAALLTAATTTTLFAMLTALNAKLPPKLSELALAVSKVSAHFCRESLSGHNGHSSGAFEAIVFGHCPWSKLGEAYLLKPMVDAETVTMTCEPVSLTDQFNYAAIGSGKERLDAEVVRLSKNYTTRLPQRAIQNIVSHNELDVGGYVSMGASFPFHFRPYWLAETLELGDPKAWRSYNGIDIDDLGSIGACFIGGTGMDRAES